MNYVAEDTQDNFVESKKNARVFWGRMAVDPLVDSHSNILQTQGRMAVSPLVDLHLSTHLRTLSQHTQSALSQPAQQSCTTTSELLDLDLPHPSAPTLHLWTSRSAVWRLTTSAKFASSIRRFLGLAEMASAASFEKMCDIAKRRNWKATTVASYWNSVQAGKRWLNLPITPEDQRATKHFEKEAHAAEVAYPTPMSEEEFRCIYSMSEMGNCHGGLVIAILVAYVLGQRISDILQLKNTDLKWEEMGATPGPTTLFLTITIRRGKVVPVIGPYALFLPQGELATMLWSWASQRGNDVFLWSQSNSLKEREAVGIGVRDILKSVAPHLEQRSVRRGGLEHMARAGHSISLIRRLFSKHSSDSMLIRYLQNGRIVLDDAVTTATVTSWIGNLANQP